MPRRITLAMAATFALACSALVPVPSQAAPLPGAFALGVESNVVPVVCIRKSSGRIACGYYDPYGNFHETGQSYDGGPYGGVPYTGMPYVAPYGESSCFCTTKSSGRVVCGIYRYGVFHEKPACYR